MSVKPRGPRSDKKANTQTNSPLLLSRGHPLRTLKSDGFAESNSVQFYTTLNLPCRQNCQVHWGIVPVISSLRKHGRKEDSARPAATVGTVRESHQVVRRNWLAVVKVVQELDRKSTRLNSSH